MNPLKKYTSAVSYLSTLEPHTHVSLYLRNGQKISGRLEEVNDGCVILAETNKHDTPLFIISAVDVVGFKWE